MSSPSCPKLYCAIVSLRIHEELKAINSWWKEDTYTEESHVVKTIKDAGEATVNKSSDESQNKRESVLSTKTKTGRIKCVKPSSVI